MAEWNGGGGGDGHVAYVESVLASGAIIVSGDSYYEGSVAPSGGYTDEVEISPNSPAWPDTFIHLADAAATVRASAAVVINTAPIVFYHDKAKQADATIAGSVVGAEDGGALQLWSSTFPFTNPGRLSQSSVLHNSGTASFDFTVAPAYATHYWVEVANPRATATPSTLNAFSSPMTTVYSGPGSVAAPAPACARPTCHLSYTATEFVSPGTPTSVIDEHVYAYLGVTLGSRVVPATLSLTTRIIVSKPVEIGADTYRLTISGTFYDGRGAYVWRTAFCSLDHESKTGIGLPFPSRCGDQAIPTDSAYLG